MELRVQAYQLPEAITFNFDELKTAISEKAQQYETLVYTDENIRLAKKDRSELNSLKKALNDERIRRQREYFKPFDAFKSQIDEIISIIDKPVQAIDAQIKDYEAIQADKKKENIQELFKDMLFPTFVNVEQIWNPKWLNATFSMNQIEQELLAHKQRITSEVQTLAALPKHSIEAVFFYQKTLDVAGALAKVNELAEMEKATKQEKIEELPFAPAETKEEPTLAEAAPRNEESKWIAFEALLTTEQALKLKNFFDTNNITFKPLK